MIAYTLSNCHAFFVLPGPIIPFFGGRVTADVDLARHNLLLGPRRVGKSTLIRHIDQPFELIDLLKTDLFFEDRSRPALLREQFATTAHLIVIDEIQKIPELLSEVHWLIENSRNRLLLTSSSARKLRRSGGTNLAKRLKTLHLHPLTWAETPTFDLLKRLQYGGLPPVVLGNDPWGDLKDYCGEYLKSENDCRVLPDPGGHPAGVQIRADPYHRYQGAYAVGRRAAAEASGRSRDPSAHLGEQGRSTAMARVPPSIGLGRVRVTRPSSGRSCHG